RDEEHVDEEEGGRADQPQLLRDGGVDEVGVEVRDQRVPARRLEGAAAESRAAEVPVPDRVERLHELVALAVLSKRWLAADRAVDLVRRPGVEPDRHALAD